MSRKHHGVDAVRNEILAAIEELRSVAKSGEDTRRYDVAEWLYPQFTGVSERRVLRAAAANGLSLYRGGMGSFQDVGYADMDHAVNRLHRALRRGRSWFLHNW